jgi:voltage-gated potassium channel
MTEVVTLRDKLRALYFGDTQLARRFRYSLLAFDLVVVSLFLFSSFYQASPWIIAFDLILGLLLLVEFCTRLYAEYDWRRHLRSFTTLADVVVIASLLVPVAFE